MTLGTVITDLTLGGVLTTYLTMATINTSTTRRREKKKVSATYLQITMFLVFGLLLICTGYTSFCIGVTFGETYNELEEDTYNPNILDTISFHVKTYKV